MKEILTLDIEPLYFILLPLLFYILRIFVIKISSLALYSYFIENEMVNYM